MMKCTNTFTHLGFFCAPTEPTSSSGEPALSRYLHTDESELHLLPGALRPGGAARALVEAAIGSAWASGTGFIEEVPFELVSDKSEFSGWRGGKGSMSQALRVAMAQWEVGYLGSSAFLFVAEIWQISPQMKLLVGVLNPRPDMLTDSTSGAESA